MHPWRSWPFTTILTAGFDGSISGGPGPGSVRCTGRVGGSWPVVRERTVSLNRWSSCNNLCKGMEICQMVRAYHTRSSSSVSLSEEGCDGTRLI